MNEIRPRDLAVLLLASGDLAPRQRARDQQADRAGLDLKRRVLEYVAAADPEPENLEETLADLVAASGYPSGPLRALALQFKEEWQLACATPGWTGHLLDEAVHAPESAQKDRSGG